MEMDRSEILSRRIADILNEKCPAFIETREGASVWHGCFCKAQTSESTEMEHCDCVWHITDSCVAGTWPHLDFINDKRRNKQESAKVFLEQAKQAIAKAEKD